MSPPWAATICAAWTAAALLAAGPARGGDADRTAEAFPRAEANQPAKATTLAPATASGYALTDAEFGRLYGPGVFVIDALGNLIVGEVRGQTHRVAQRFRASAAGEVQSIVTYWTDGPGYASGTGGVIRVRIVPDDDTADHHPDLSASALAVGSYTPALRDGRRSASRINDPVAMRSSAPLVRGRLYHVVYENIDRDPAMNFLSVNCVVTLIENGPPSRWLSVLDWAALASTAPAGSGGSGADAAAAGPAWSDLNARPRSGRAHYAPILQVTLADGSVLGNTVMETGNTGSRHWHASAAHPVRERFSPRTARLVAGFSVHAAPERAGALGWQLKEGGRTLASGRIEGTARPYASSAGLGHATGVFHWFDVEFGKTVPLEAGATYDLVFTPQAEAVWRFADQRNGSAKGYLWPAAFSESQAQVWYTGYWHHFNHWYALLSTRGSNWRVVLHQAR